MNTRYIKNSIVIFAFALVFQGHLAFAALAPAIQTDPATGISATGATLNGFFNTNGDTTGVWFDYGINTPAYGQTTTQQTKTAGTSGAFSAAISYPACTTPVTIYYRAYGINSHGAGTDSGSSFSVPCPNAITTQTNPATNITTSGATLNGFFNLNGNSQSASTIYFEYSANTQSFSQSTAPTSPSSTFGSYARTISGLSSNTLYWFRLVTINAAGLHTNGSAVSFTTGGATPPPPSTYECNDGIDNDGDGYIDYPADPGCTGATDNTEYPNPAPAPTYECSDHLDNDGDGFIDYPNDPDCTSYSDLENVYNGGGGGGYYSAPLVTTNNASNTGSSSAILNGYVDPYGANATRWFEWGNSYGNLYYSLYVSGSQSYAGNFSQSISGLSSGATYYFRACAQTSYGQNCGATNSFSTSGGSYYGGGEGQAPFVLTEGASNITATGATLSGWMNPYGASATRWFAWGTSQTVLPYTLSVSGTQSQDTEFSASLSGILPNTTYYFRACGQNSYGQNCGITYYITTPSGPPVATTHSGPSGSTTYIYTGSSGTSSSQGLMTLSIDSHYETVYAGDIVDYTITYKNISGKTLQNGILRVTIPDGIEFQKTSAGAYQKSDRTVTIPIGTIVPKQTGIYSIEGKVGSFGSKNQLTATARLVFTNTNGAQEEAIAYEWNTVAGTSGNPLSGLAIFSGAGFLPSTLGGWIILLVIIFLVIFFARKIYLSKKY